MPRPKAQKGLPDRAPVTPCRVCMGRPCPCALESPHPTYAHTRTRTTGTRADTPQSAYTWPGEEDAPSHRPATPRLGSYGTSQLRGDSPYESNVHRVGTSNTGDHGAALLILKPFTIRFCSTACAEANAPDIMDITCLLASVSVACPRRTVRRFAEGAGGGGKDTRCRTGSAAVLRVGQNLYTRGLQRPNSAEA